MRISLAAAGTSVISQKGISAGVSIVVLCAGFSVARCTAQESSPRWAVRIVFGTEDNEPTDWSGKIVAPSDLLNRIELEAWRFAVGQGDSIQPKQKSWKASTRLGIAPLARQPVQGANDPPATQIPWPIGITILGAGPEPARLGVETVRGSFDINMRDLRWGAAQHPQNGVRVERAVAPQGELQGRVDGSSHVDFPALLSTRQGELAVAGLVYRDATDEIAGFQWSADEFGNGRLSPASTLSPAGDHASLSFAEDGSAAIWAVWSQQVEGNWDLYARRRVGSEWSRPLRLTDDPGPDIFPAAASCADGTVAIVWQGFRDGQSDIFLRRIDSQSGSGFKLGPEIRVSTSVANDWMPGIATDAAGAIHVVWDSYDSGNYDIMLRTLRGSEWSPVRAVASTPASETQASVACDARGRVWVAYDEGTEAWGKDYGFWWWIQKWPQGTRLYERRRFCVRCLDGEKLQEPSDPFANLAKEFQEFSEQPMIRVDGRGVPWLFFRHRTAKNPRADGWAAGGWWELHAIRYDGDRWSDPIPFPRSMGRQSQPSAAVATKDGLAVAWGSDGRTFQQPADGIRSQLFLGFIDNSTPDSDEQRSSPMLRPVAAYDGRGVTVTNVHADEPGDVKRVREYSASVAGKQLKIYRGDLHRHTEISGDGVGDGTLTDLYRYALDAAAMDFIMVTDHGMGADREYPWWRTQKSNDMYHLKSRFVPIYGYERSITYPWGHRNVIWPDRGHKTFPTTKAAVEPAKAGEPTKKAAAQRPADDDTEQLYAYLRKNGGIVTGHTSASDQGTNWETGFDPQLEPFVELFQGYHTSYEGPGTPLAIDDKTAIVHGAYRPAGFVWNALEKGYRLGFQASSDHIATHNSYACVWAESLERRALIDGMKKRHTYAATDNIILDVRSGEHMMGDEFAAEGPLTLQVNVVGTAPLTHVEIVRNKSVVYAHDAKGARRAEFHWTDMQPVASLHYYYLRIQQADRQMAWSSPMWIHRMNGSINTQRTVSIAVGHK